MAGISFAIHIAVYQCFYKPRIRSSASTCTPICGKSHCHTHNEGITESGDAIVYDVVDERVDTTLEMRENEACSVNKGEGGLEMKQNEAYGVTKST